MFWVMSAALYAYLTLKTDKYATQAFIFFITFNIAWAFVHGNGAFVTAFQLLFGLMTALMILSMFYYQTTIGTPKTKRILQLYIGTALAGLICWLTDWHFCAEINEKLLVNPQLHSWWHVFIGMAAHYSLMFEFFMKQSLVKKDNE
mmetsp:Transcript_23684/g.41962  ORF Transcript_23684/g.41962 Transcript_23684/m.41962 type:complete len:146 (+) Transcript_23684:1049-1486(+)